MQRAGGGRRETAAIPRRARKRPPRRQPPAFPGRFSAPKRLRRYAPPQSAGSPDSDVQQPSRPSDIRRVRDCRLRDPGTRSRPPRTGPRRFSSRPLHGLACLRASDRSRLMLDFRPWRRCSGGYANGRHIRESGPSRRPSLGVMPSIGISLRNDRRPLRSIDHGQPTGMTEGSRSIDPAGACLRARRTP